MTNHDSGFCTFLVFIGRVAMSVIFILAGVMKIVDFNSTASMMSGMNLPGSEFLLVLAIIFELGGGVLLLLGWYTRFASILLLIFVVVVTFYFHSFWNFEGALQVGNIHHFMKNLFIFGALLYVLVHGAGRFSIDNVCRKCK